MKKIIIYITLFISLQVQAADFIITVQSSGQNKKTEVAEMTCSQVSGGSFLHRQIGSWVDSVDNSSALSFSGCCSVNIKVGVFSGTPYCTINNSAAVAGAGGECSGCNVWNRSSTKVDICSSGNNQRFTLICIGQ